MITQPVVEAGMQSVCVCVSVCKVLPPSTGTGVGGAGEDWVGKRGGDGAWGRGRLPQRQ